MAAPAKNSIASFVRYNRGKLRLTQEELAQKAGLGLRFVRDLEQGKDTLRMDKVNELLALFGFHLAPVPARRADPYAALQENINRPVTLVLRSKLEIKGEIIEPVFTNNEITGWKFLHQKDREAYRRSGDRKLLMDVDNSEIDHINND